MANSKEGIAHTHKKKTGPVVGSFSGSVRHEPVELGSTLLARNPLGRRAIAVHEVGRRDKSLQEQSGHPSKKPKAFE
jgi:hypothetical protein